MHFNSFKKQANEEDSVAQQDRDPPPRKGEIAGTPAQKNLIIIGKFRLDFVRPLRLEINDDAINSMIASYF